MAESIFLSKIEASTLRGRIKIDSAGTGNWHTGEKPDPRTVAELERNGFTWSSTARQVSTQDFQTFDLLLAMDQVNLRDLQRMGAPMNKVQLMLNFDEAAQVNEVPDPYYGSTRDFQRVFQMLEPACEGLLMHLNSVLAQA